MLKTLGRRYLGAPICTKLEAHKPDYHLFEWDSMY